MGSSLSSSSSLSFSFRKVLIEVVETTRTLERSFKVIQRPFNSSHNLSNSVESSLPTRVVNFLDGPKRPASISLDLDYISLQGGQITKTPTIAFPL